MSDYLSHLVARIANQVETIQPRLQSLFEPVHGMTGMTGMGWQGVAALDVEESLVESHRQPLPATSNNPLSISLAPFSIQDLPSSVPSRIDMSTDSETEPSYLLNDASRQQRSQPDPLTPIIQCETITSSLPIDLPHVPLQPTIQSVITEHTVVERIFETETDSVAARMTSRADVQSKDEIRPAVIVPLSTPEASPAPRQPLSAASQGTGTDSSASPPPIVTTVMSTSVTPQIRPAPSSVPTVEASLPVPTIQVTIGRIEVRATPSSPSPSTKPRKSSPVMSLEDYLRQRGGGA